METFGNSMDFMYIAIIFCSLLLSTTNCQKCRSVEMVQNGNFSLAVNQSPTNLTTTLPGQLTPTYAWTTNSQNNKFQIHQQGSQNARIQDAYGFPTGQHLEILNTANALFQPVVGNEQVFLQILPDFVENSTIMYEFVVPCLLESNAANFSFQWWANSNYSDDRFQVQIEQQNQVLLWESVEVVKGGNWSSVAHKLEVYACAPLQLSFEGDSTGGLHIDNISLQLQVCDEINVVVNGDFELPEIDDPFLSTNLANLPGNWSTTNGFVLWKQGKLGVPQINAAGIPTGQQLEINGYDNKGVVWYEAFIPAMSREAMSSIEFEYYFKPAQIIYYFNFTVIQNDTTFLREQLYYGQEFGLWQRVNFIIYDLISEMTVQLIFSCDSEDVGGVRIDNVSMKISEYTKYLDFTY